MFYKISSESENLNSKISYVYKIFFLSYKIMKLLNWEVEWKMQKFNFSYLFMYSFPTKVHSILSVYQVLTIINHNKNTWLSRSSKEDKTFIYDFFCQLCTS